MRAALATALLLTLASGARADLGDFDTSLAEVAFDEMQVSPDGSRLAFITRVNDFGQDREVSTLWGLDLSGGGEPARPVRLAESGTYASLLWSPDGRSLAFLSATAPGEAFQLFVQETASGSVPRRVTDPVRFANGVDLYDWLPDGTGFIVMATDPPDAASTAAQARWRELYGDVRRKPGPPPASSLYKVAREDGRTERLAASPFEASSILSASPDGRQAAVAEGFLQGGVEATEVAILPLVPGASPRRTRNFGWEETLAWAGKDLFASVSGEEKDGRYTITEARLFRVNAEDMTLVPAAPRQEGYLKQQVPLADGSLLVTANVSTRTRVSRLEPGSGPGSGKIRTLLEQRGWIANLSASRDGGVIAFVTSDSRNFPEIYVARGLDGLAKARPVTDFNTALTREPLPEIETVSWDDGEGTAVEGVLFWPPGRKGEKGLPLIVELHGGPFSIARTEAVSLSGQFLSFPAVLAARGFLVLNPNYRGGAGRGDEFAQGIEGRRCSRPSRDVILGVESLIARGWADRERIGLMGYSGGGGLSKCLLGRTNLFRAVSTGAGVWNDIEVFSSVRGPMWAESFFQSTSPWKDFELWWRESPISGLERIQTPTLIISGERDGDAPRQADELYRSLIARGVTVESLVFPGEGHVFTRPTHKRAKMRAEISWLEHYLLGKPRAELP